MEQIRQIYRWKSLLFGLVRLENYGGLFDVGEAISKNSFYFKNTYCTWCYLSLHLH